MIRILKYIIGVSICLLFIISCKSGGGNMTNISGCTDPLACNFNTLANIDDNTCYYEEENYDCEGNCIVEIDECGECGGDNSTCDSNVQGYVNHETGWQFFQSPSQVL